MQIRLVRENLALALSLRDAAQQGIISAGFVDRTSVQSSNGNTLRTSAPLEVHDTKDLVRCVNNQIRGAFVFSALQANRTLESLYGNSPISDAASEMQSARCILYLLSHTVAQNMMVPVWVCPSEYRRTFEVPSASFSLDASTLNGKKVYWDDFGGLPKYLDLLEFCSNQSASQTAFSQKIGNQKPTNGEKLTPEPNSSSVEQPNFDSVVMDSISSFVEACCLIDNKESVLAKSLFECYLEWCDSKGYQPLSQRGFGMRLTSLGFQRRRRGKGKHWWMGVSLTESPVTVSGAAD